jgi:hypothetical protein
VNPETSRILPSLPSGSSPLYTIRISSLMVSPSPFLRVCFPISGILTYSDVAPLLLTERSG